MQGVEDGLCRPLLATAAMIRTTLTNYFHRSRRSLSTVPAVHQSIAGRKRFYKNAGIAAAPEGNKYVVTLDGRTLKTPARNPLELANPLLAMAIAAEWDAQTDQRRGIQPVNMPLMSLASTAIDQVQLDPQTAINTCMKYLPTDSALFMAADFDRILLSKQKQYLSPVIEWYKKELNMDLEVTQSMATKIEHPAAVVDRFNTILNRLDHYSLACLQGAVMESKSLVLSLAFLARQIPLEDMVIASRLEEEFQVEIWGVVEGGHDMDRLNNSVRLSSVATFMSLCYDEQQVAAMWKEWTK